ncbi:hypothetical protein HUB98_06215 [Paenibacillus barcinonensis]|uniref:Uncharacterized protein n=1 Tax=Paenibacillus barcinonensis TaxID=198119 RepID=A0A2V4VDJ9_PAEBA|nr:hypothetical protein [Paenibacillus barcinonensis]PYE51608.1 hypothetical protein DFQ00_102403 [Paenibacillus barcinonensis]QKS55975.1 hypothetical protein HUB98_06215 [Paenibacillus barcinonensis]
MIDKFKTVIRPDNFKVQPSKALDELLSLEAEYGINTTDVLSETNTSIPERIVELWINTLDTYVLFDGCLTNLNHISK